MNDRIYCGDALDVLHSLPSTFVDCCVTSPPYYGLRNYGIDGQIGIEKSPDKYIEALVKAFREVRRVLRDDGTLWVNIGDSYAGKRQGGYKSKDLIGIPWMLAFALRSDGWYLRQDIVWHKPNPMPESVTDRCTKAHEYIFLLSKTAKYYFDNDAIREPLSAARAKQAGQRVNPGNDVESRSEVIDHDQSRGSGGHFADGHKWYINPNGKNKRDVWTVSAKPLKEAHFATFPPDLIRPCILAGSRPGGTVLDPFLGSGTTAVVANSEGRKYIGIDIKPEYCEMSEKRLRAHMAE